MVNYLDNNIRDVNNKACKFMMFCNINRDYRSFKIVLSYVT